MSTYRIRLLQCDRCTAQRWSVPGERGRGFLRRALAEGWDIGRHGIEDLCPACATAQPCPVRFSFGAGHAANCTRPAGHDLEPGGGHHFGRTYTTADDDPARAVPYGAVYPERMQP